MISKLTRGVLVLSLAVPAIAQAAPAAPAVQDGDMGCMIATGMFAMMADQLAAKPETTAQDREGIIKLRDQAFNANNFFMGRMTMLPADKTGQAAYKAAFGRYTALKQEDQIKMIQACMEFSKTSKGAILDSWDK